MASKKFEVDFELGSVNFRVAGYLDGKVIDSITSVKIWTMNGYQDVRVNDPAFIHDYSDLLYDALYEQEENLRLAAADDMYDRMRLGE